VRGFTQDDAHIFIMPEQLEQEVNSVLDFTFDVLKQFGFTEYEVTIGTRPEKAIGTEEQWAKGEETLQKIAQKWFFDKGKITFNLEHGGGAFYGPKIDIKLKDAIGRFWQCSTIQLDFNLPERFDLNYIGQDGHHHRPLMIHRAILGSVERFIGTLIEHYAGAFPLWLAPIQAAILPITGEQLEYAHSIDAQLRANGLRTLLGEGSGTISKQIRNCEVQKIPYMLVVGAREAAAGTVAVRSRGSKKDEGVVRVEQFLERIQGELRTAYSV
jgi:threonyl-tRNA synthetase